MALFFVGEEIGNFVLQKTYTNPAIFGRICIGFSVCERSKMMNKKKSWQDIKRSKSPEQWKKERQAYNSRRIAKDVLHKKALQLIERIYISSFISDVGLAKTLRKEVREALRLRNGWSQKDYDAAVNHLAEAEKGIVAFANRRKQVNADLLDAILVSFRLSDAPVEEKLAVLLEAMVRIGDTNKSEEMVECQRSLPNFVHSLCRQIPGFYPAWFPEVYARQGLGLLTPEDKQKVLEIFRKDLLLQVDKDFLAEMFAPDEFEQSSIDI